MADERPKHSSSFGRILRKKKIEDLGADEEAQHLHQAKKRTRTDRHPNQHTLELLSASPNKYWSLSDDLMLIDMAALCNYDDIASIERFAGRFSPKEVRERWAQLLYDSKTPTALSQVGDEIYSSRCFWTVKEDQLLSNAEVSDTAGAQALLGKHRSVFHSSRTAKQIEERYNDLTKNRAEQVTPPLSVNDAPPTSSTVQPVPQAASNDEGDVVPYDPLHLDAELAAPPQDWTEWQQNLSVPSVDNSKEDKLAIRARKKTYAKVEKNAHRTIYKGEKEYEKERERERDSKLLATIRGSKLRYMMRTKEIVLGRVGGQVDVNLNEEGPASKCSRRHIIIKIKRDGEFYLKNIGKRSVFVNGKLLKTSKYSLLKDNSIIEVCGLRFIFEINKTLYNKVKRQLL